MSDAELNNSPRTIPVLLLKTKSSPGDGYEELFSSITDSGFVFEPRFLPVLEHGFKPEGVECIRKLLKARDIGPREECAYGGLIFTSQRAVEAFAAVVTAVQGDQGWPHLEDVPVYSVGPATTRALKAVPQQPPLNIFGEHTGNGESLANFMLDHYGDWYEARPEKPPLLFLVGEQRRDIIPKTLMDAELPRDRRIHVDELVVYGTGVMESFEEDFSNSLKDTSGAQTRWVVIFSPTGCQAMLTGLGLLDETTGKATKTRGSRARSTFVATIGPTTRDYLLKTFDYEPDVCAAEPSPKGIQSGIIDFMQKRPTWAT